MLIKQVEDFKLVYCAETNSYLIIKCLADNSDILIAKILLLSGATIPSLVAIEDHLQNYVLDFKEYKNFIQLVDEAYFRVEALKKMA